MAAKSPLCRANFAFDERYHKPKKDFSSLESANQFCNGQHGGKPYRCPDCRLWHITTKKGKK